MANRWYVKQEGRELGPFSDSGLRRFLESDRARPGALVSDGPNGPWPPASQCDALQAAQGGRRTTRKLVAVYHPETLGFRRVNDKLKP